ncbi:MAG: hypothetical protein MAG794_00820 [Gammaproteobacteria bacterium]|nr:hypothetical protein [Gammaproteobacteria bacterium]
MAGNLESKISNICVKILRNSSLLRANFALILNISSLNLSRPQLIEMPLKQNEARGPLAGKVWLNLGFRPFFLGAAVFAVISVIVWTLVYTLSFPLPIVSISPFQWHAHEMIYGYGLAVIAGFLLTAVRNWTGMQTLYGLPLLGLFCFWAAARVFMLFGTAFIFPAALFDLLFITMLIAAVVFPICRTGGWRQIGIVSKLVLLGAGSVVFYLGCFGYLQSGVYWGVYGGLYLVIGLILTMGRRTIPFFIEKGVGYPVTLFNSKWIDVSSLLLFFALFVFELFVEDKTIVPFLSAALFVVNLVRLAGWHTPGLWKKPLLWSLYVAYGFVVAGFLLLALSGFAGVSKFIAVHSFAYGGMGLITLSMMARVSLGHTARDIHKPPPGVLYSIIALSSGALFRILFPLAFPEYYVTWVVLSQFLWIAAFAILAIILFPMLTTPRTDGRFG